MKIVNNLKNINPIYSQFYDYNRIQRDFKNWPEGLRLGDMWPAVCYLHGIYDVPSIKNLDQQLSWIKANRKKRPTSILEIGGGDGLLSVFLSNIDPECKIQTVECNHSAEHWFRAVSRQYFGTPCGDNIQLYLGDLDTSYESLDLATLDAVIMVESIEHIESAEWHRFFKKLAPVLKSNQGSLTITNIVNYWPLGGPGDGLEHISLIDDQFYDYLSSVASRCVTRKKSHICLEFDNNQIHTPVDTLN
jgi:2-polyprenyl-3-methyl-5-hydroxy-6-metoxy-1,4-benzoquinol methylase